MTEECGRSFAGKIALVTGGSRGIGEGIVRRLASDGAAVAFTYFNSEEGAKRLASEIDAAGGTALPIKADSASAEDIRQQCQIAMKAKSVGLSQMKETNDQPEYSPRY